MHNEFINYDSAALIPNKGVGYFAEKRIQEAFKELTMSIGMDLRKV